MSHSYHEIVVGDRGRLVLPSGIRARLGIERGTRMILSMEPDGSLRLQPYRAVADGSRGLLARLPTVGASLVDELIAQRHVEAAREHTE